VSGELAQEAQSWSPDSLALAYYVHAEVESRDIWILPLSGDRPPVPYLTTGFNEHSPSFSPDGISVDGQLVFFRPFHAREQRMPLSETHAGFGEKRVLGQNR